MLTIGRLGRAEVHRYTMLDDEIALKNLLEHMQRSPAIDHVIF
jgi:hypothetical protein